MPKFTLFLLKNRENCPALGSLPPDPLCFRGDGALVYLIPNSSLRAEL